ncbi:Ig-like domain-containing protein, partial [Alkalihalophilus lindianensis]
DVFVQMRVDSGYVSNLDYMVLVANEEKIEVEKIELLTNAITTLKKGKNLTIKTKISPETATDKSVTWEVENNKIAEVSGDGTIIG